ncbi:MAG: hypothetical protein PUG87_08940 [Eubacteriales bacterium]|nr:hypothetical protein [Clostridiales bacterium]MDD7302054.1 hypothetical protein [Eubacteriales bacterium]MDY4435185.1 hypothetical protein [Candidatus Flemingibacterium sp.]
MDNVKAAFRTAMGGYNKQDVNNYIAGLCERFESEKKALEEKNAALESELAKARGAEPEKAKNPRAELAALLSADKNDGAETQAANTSDREMLVKAEALVTAQNARLDEQKKTISERDSEISELKTRVSDLELELESAREKLDSFRDVNEKIADYDRMSAKVGDVLIKAEADADRIRAEAEEKAAERMKAAELAEKDFSIKETEMKAELERRREAAEKELDARIAGLSENRFRELNDTLESASAEIGKLLDKLKADIASKSQVADSTVRTVDEK